MPTAGAERPEGRDASGIGFYFNADDTWHSGSEAPPRAWDPAWIAPPHTDWPAEPPVRRRRSGLAVALGLALVAAAAIALAWSLTPARRLSPQVRQAEPPSAVLIPPLPVEPPAAAPAAKPAPVSTAVPALHPAAAHLAPHHRRHLRTAHHRHGARASARLHATLKHPAAHRRPSHHVHSAVRSPLRHGEAAPHDRNNSQVR